MKKMKVYSKSLEMEMDMDVNVYESIKRLQTLNDTMFILIYDYKLSVNDPMIINTSDLMNKEHKYLNRKRIYKEYRRVSWEIVK